MNYRQPMLAFALLIALGALPCAAAEPRSGKSDDALARNRAAQMVAQPTEMSQQPATGKAGIDRFSVRRENIRESVRADGTTIVELNGEGMEQMTLDDSTAVPRAVCSSLIEHAMKTNDVPEDFRGALQSRGGAREHR